jgi:hypothetical protein
MNVVGTTADVYIWSFILNRTAVVAFFAGFTLLGVQVCAQSNERLRAATNRCVCVSGLFSGSRLHTICE